MLNKFQHGSAFSATATGTTTAVASKAGAAGFTHVALTASVSSDKAGSILLIKDGTTVIWQGQVGVGFSDITFPAGLSATTGALLSVEIDGTSVCKANLSGVTI